LKPERELFKTTENSVLGFNSSSWPINDQEQEQEQDDDDATIEGVHHEFESHTPIQMRGSKGCPYLQS
jgi:hypothetical protein